jgi:TonB family protein
MITKSIGATQRSIANKSLIRTLLIGLGGSLLCHTVAIAGITYFAQNAEESIEIIQIERVELDPAPVTSPSTKPIVPITKPAVPPPVRAIAPIAKPPLLALEPKVVKSIGATVPSPKPVVIPTPKPIATSPPVVKITKKLAPIKRQIAPLTNFVSPQPTLVAKPSPPSQDFRPKTDRSQPPPFTPNQFKETNNQPALGNTPLPSTQSAPKRNQKTGGDFSNDRSTPKQPDQPNKLARSSPKSPIDNNQTSPANPNKNSQNKPSQDLGKTPDDPTKGNAPIGDFDSGGSGNSSQIAPSNAGNGGINNQPVAGGGNGRGGSDGNGSGAENRQNGSPGGTVGGTGNGNRANNSNGNNPLGTGKPGNIATGSTKQLSIQCLSNCDIKYPDNLEDVDTGKDKILVRVTIDPAGNTTNVEIARSSGNPKLDSFTVAGVQQMRFTAMGKSLTFKIKVSTLIGN